MKALKRSNTSTSNRTSSSSPALSWIHLKSLLIFGSSPVHDRGSLKVLWSRAKRRGFSHRYWNSLFTPDGRLHDGGIRLLRKTRSKGIDPSIRSEVWPFLLGVYDLNSTELERCAVKLRKWKEYENLRLRCRALSNHHCRHVVRYSRRVEQEQRHNVIEDLFWSEDFSASVKCPVFDATPPRREEVDEEEEEDDDEDDDDDDVDDDDDDESLSEMDFSREILIENAGGRRGTAEEFRTWQRIIRLDAIRADAEWAAKSGYSAVSRETAEECAGRAGLKDYEHLEPRLVRHASRLVCVLEAYAVYDPEIGYCQGMSDLLSPLLAVMEDDYEAFWCFVGFMRKARQNFSRVNESGISRQLAAVSRIIRLGDGQLFRRLERMQAEDCFFVYRMVLVLLRRELSFQQTLCLWEVMWAEQAALRSGIGTAACGRLTMRSPPTDDLLLYAIAACVIHTRKLFLDSCGTLDEIIKEYANMAGKLDVWTLLDHAHHLVLTLRDKIKLSP